ncbi:MAG: hypothetical protein EBS19_16370, partial [Spirochaetia bacterium]|nr:hypothetical protein [Spirochaetia bacterium]
MERDGVIGHGASFFLRESMMERGDKYQVAICNKTGMIAIFNPERNIFISPFSDGPIRFSGTINSESVNVNMVTKYGRSFSILQVPYAFKLLIHELQAMNIQMRIITEDNIDQISSMTFSDNIVKLLGKDASISQVVKTSESILVNQGQTIKKKARKNEEEKTVTERVTSALEPVSSAIGTVAKKISDFIAPIANEAQVVANGKQVVNENNENNTDGNNKQKLKEIHNLGWYYKKKLDDDKIFASIILDENGRETEVWSFKENNKYPDRFPLGWKQEEVPYLNGNPIDRVVIVKKLRDIRKENNWNKVMAFLKRNNEIGNIPSSVPFNTTPTSPIHTQTSPPYLPITP